MAAMLELYSQPFLIFTLVLTRLSGVLLLMPIVGIRPIPPRIRGLLGIGMALAITPLQTRHALPDVNSLPQLLGMAASEAFIGLSIGLAASILFAGVQVAGQLISQTAGVSLADIFDPTFESSVSSTTQLMDIVTLAVFVTTGGHRQVIAALLDTYEWTPPGQAQFSEGVVPALTEIMTISLATGIRAGAPCLLALLIAVLVTAIVSRTLPQLNILALGFNLNTILLMAGLAFTLGAGAWLFQDVLENVLARVTDTRGAAP